MKPNAQELLPEKLWTKFFMNLLLMITTNVFFVGARPYVHMIGCKELSPGYETSDSNLGCIPLVLTKCIYMNKNNNHIQNKR